MHLTLSLGRKGAVAYPKSNSLFSMALESWKGGERQANTRRKGHELRSVLYLYPYHAMFQVFWLIIHSWPHCGTHPTFWAKLFSELYPQTRKTFFSVYLRNG